MHKLPTKEEILLKEALEKLGLRVMSQVPDGYKHIDLSIPDAKINIEVDGPAHLTDSSKILSDFKRDCYSLRNGYDTIRIPNELIHSDLGGVASALAEAAAIKIETNKQSC